LTVQCRITWYQALPGGVQLVCPPPVKVPVALFKKVEVVRNK
jgi:hypothetical protein